MQLLLLSLFVAYATAQLDYIRPVSEETCLQCCDDALANSLFPDFDIASCREPGCTNRANVIDCVGLGDPERILGCSFGREFFFAGITQASLNNGNDEIFQCSQQGKVEPVNLREPLATEIDPFLNASVLFVFNGVEFTVRRCTACCATIIEENVIESSMDLFGCETACNEEQFCFDLGHRNRFGCLAGLNLLTDNSVTINGQDLTCGANNVIARGLTDFPTTSPTENPTTSPTPTPTDNPTISPINNPTLSPLTPAPSSSPIVTGDAEEFLEQTLSLAIIGLGGFCVLTLMVVFVIFAVNRRQKRRKRVIRLDSSDGSVLTKKKKKNGEVLVQVAVPAREVARESFNLQTYLERKSNMDSASALTKNSSGAGSSLPAARTPFPAAAQFNRTSNWTMTEPVQEQRLSF